MADDELDFVDEQSEARSTDFSSISSARSQKTISSFSKRSNGGLLMGRSKHKRLKERIQSSQSSEDVSVAEGNKTSLQHTSRITKPSTPSSSTTRPTKKRRYIKSALAKIPENETIGPMVTYRNDHFSVKDAAQSQMLLDECLFLCESIMGQRDALEPMQSLADMLSNKENRRQLFFTSLASQSLKGVLDVFAWIRRFVTDSHETDSPKTWSPQSDTGSTTSNVVLDKRPILNAAKMLAYHISLDCTLSPEAAHAAKKGSAAAARRIRKAILSNPLSMQGLAQLVLDDELTERLRDNGKGVGTPRDFLQNDTSPNSKMDPTLHGRIKRKQLKMARSSGSCGSRSPEGNSEALSFASEPSAKRILSFASKKASAKGIKTNLGKSDGGSRDQPTGNKLTKHQKNGKHTCRDQLDDTPSTEVLLAVKRIISAKHEDTEESAIDDDEGLEVDEVAEYTEDYNPIVATNQLLASSGALPFLSRSLSNTLVAAIAQTRFRSGGCEACTSYLSSRICSLASIADAASLFNVSNRVSICNEGFTPETNGYIVVCMISFLRAFLGIRKRRPLVLGGEYGEISLSILKTLTSLSHENDVVANELKTKLAFGKGSKPSETTGLDVLVAFLRECVVTKAGNDRESKMLYDCQIYCLSILANIATNYGCVEMVTNMKVTDTDQGTQTSFLKWISKWLVSLTVSFHDAIMESSFGKSGSVHDDRILSQSEEEGLVASGKGFIFLARVLLQHNGETVTRLIFAEIPGDDFHDKMKMMKNTLKAFLSFYRQSVGGLSMAIFAPLKVLLQKLDTVEFPS